MSVLEEMRQQAIRVLDEMHAKAFAAWCTEFVDALHDAAREIAQEELAKFAGRLELGSTNEDEKLAWDAYMAGMLADPSATSITNCAKAADVALEERRKRWGKAR